MFVKRKEIQNKNGQCRLAFRLVNSFQALKTTVALRKRNCLVSVVNVPACNDNNDAIEDVSAMARGDVPLTSGDDDCKRPSWLLERSAMKQLPPGHVVLSCAEKSELSL